MRAKAALNPCWDPVLLLVQLRVGRSYVEYGGSRSVVLKTDQSYWEIISQILFSHIFEHSLYEITSENICLLLSKLNIQQDEIEKSNLSVIYNSNLENFIDYTVFQVLLIDHYSFR